MTKYNISGDEIIISTEVENERNLSLSTEKLVEQAGNRFDSWYEEQYSCESLLRNIGEMWYQAYHPLAQKGIELLNAVGVYSIDEDMLMGEYAKRCVDDFVIAASDMESKVDGVERQKQSEYLYRQQRKDSRGRMVGGGFGLGGALKGMATAGVVNATTGMAHSIGNAVGNIGTSIAASSNKSTILKDSKEPLKEALLKSLSKVVGGIRRALDREAGIKCRCVTDSERDSANAILSNYTQNRIPEERKKEQLLKALQLDPYNIESYYYIWEAYGDANGDLKKMSSYFGVGLETHLKNTAKEYGDDLYEKVCGTYERAWNKSETGIQLETEIKDALDHMIQYCKKCEITEDMIPAIEKCRKILRAIDTDIRTVRGVTYSTRELAENVQEDYDNFYHALVGKNIFDEKTYEDIKAINYKTQEFASKLRSLFEREQYKRIPERICENIAYIVKEKMDVGNSGGWIDIPGYMGSISEKESMIYTITGMSAGEIGLVLFDKSSNGKAGILITNYHFRIYSKGLFSNDNRAYPIEKIEEIQSLTEDEYMLFISGQEAVTFNLKRKGLSAEEQIRIAEMMSEVVTLVNNLNLGSRRELYRILRGVVRCTCGMKLLAGERICPSCKRMLMDNGEFIETEICPNCNNYIPVGKKFCSLCGFKLIDTAEYIICQTCGKRLQADSKFCIYCGAKIQ